MDGTMLDTFKKRTEQQLKAGVHALKPEEAAVLAFLQNRLAAEQKNQRSTLVEKLQASLKHRGKKSR
jgi:hypothetical protein